MTSIMKHLVQYTIMIGTVDEGSEQNCLSGAAPSQPVFYADYFLICA